VARRRSARRGKDQGTLFALIVCVVLVAVVVQEIAAHLIGFLLLLIPVTGAGAAALIIRSKKRQAAFQIAAVRSYEIAPYHRMNFKEFERAIALLCERDGCRNVQVVGGSGDLGADVIATVPDGRRIVIQAKRYAPTTKVGSGDVQKVGGTARPIHHADLVAIVTTSVFTKPALDYMRRLQIRPVNADALAGWVSRTGPAPWH
jgi:restriction system protein